MNRNVIQALIACTALATLAWCPPQAASAAGIFRDDFAGSNLDLNRWAVVHGQAVVSNGQLTLAGGATPADRADVQSIQTFTRGVWRARIQSSNWSPQSVNNPAPDSSFGFEFFTGTGCHYAITVVTNGHLGILEPVPDGGGVCSGDPARQRFVPISNWDNVSAGGIIQFRLSWRPIGLVLEVSDGGTNSGFAVYAAPLVPDADSPALPSTALKMRLNADIAETFAVDFVEVRDETVEFSDDFEVVRGWTIFEERVGPCYIGGVGEVTRSNDVAFSPAQSLRVWANATHSIFSNHVIAGNRVSLLAKTGVLRYELRAYIDPATTGSGQTGPEFSMQNTRQVAPGQFRTSTAGIQYRPALPPAERWAIWAEVAPGVAGWVPLPELASLLLEPGTWYAMTIEADYDTRAYRRFSVSREGDTGVVIDVSGFSMAEEQKPDFDSEGFSLTAESENLFSTCAGVFDYRMYYDDVTLVASSPIFADVSSTHPFFPWIETLFAAGITGGCATAPPMYCPDNLVTRDQMAVFLLRSIHGSGYDPPPATGTMFIEVPIDHPFAKWIEQLAREGFTGGCWLTPSRYCPEEPVTRGQMAVFLLRAEHGAGYDPPPATGTMFIDVPIDHLFAKWIEQLAREGITGGCWLTPPRYCPEEPVTRGQMAVFLIRTFQLAL